MKDMEGDRRGTRTRSRRDGEEIRKGKGGGKE